MGYVVDNDVKTGDDFLAAARRVMNEAKPALISSVQMLLKDMPLEDNWYYPTEKVEQLYAAEGEWSKVSAEATDGITRMLNDGVAHLDFFGHGSVNLWADERIWFGMDSPNRDSLRLKNGGRYAFIANYSCSNGAIDYPIPPWNLCISEDLMRQPGGGAIGMFVPSAPGSTPEHEPLAFQWYKVLFQDNLRGFGELVTLTRARHALAEGDGYGGGDNMLKMYLLLGDPALKLRLVSRWQPLTLSARSADPAAGFVTASLTGASPATGQALAWLEDADGNTLWKSEPAAYRGGEIKTQIALGKGLKTPADLRACVYGWNPVSGGDFLASAPLHIGEAAALDQPAPTAAVDGSQPRPRLRIGRSDSNSTRPSHRWSDRLRFVHG